MCISLGTEGDLIKELREVSPKAQALVLSAILDRRETASWVEAGAAGVLTKTANVEWVVYAVRRLRTERDHMASILDKLEVHSHPQALVFALRHGIVEIP